jgi:hypothetical protein
MIIIGKKGIIEENVKENEDGELELFNMDIINDIQINECYPFINIPYPIGENSWIECEIGCLCVTGLIKDSKVFEWGFKSEVGRLSFNKIPKKYFKIEIGNISICTIRIQKESEQNQDILYYHYEILIEIHGQKTNTINHLFKADDFMRKDITIGYYDRYYVKAMRYLFQNVIPLINKYVESQQPVELLNFNYLEKMLPQKGNYKTIIHPFTLSDAMNIIYDMKVEITNDYKIVRFGLKNEEYMNYYMADLINSILDIKLKYDNTTKTSYSTLPIIPNVFCKNIDSITRYLSCLLYLGIIKNFDDERAKQEYLIAVPTGEFLSFSTKPVEKEIPSNKYIDIFSFIFNMDATHFEDGQTRVGRDDMEWEEKTFIFPPPLNFVPNTQLIQAINELLEIELIYEEKKETPSYASHPARYYYFEKFNYGSVSGLSRSRREVKGFRRISFHKIVRFFTDCYLYDQDKFNTFIDN